jgi:hypothetical protein
VAGGHLLRSRVKSQIPKIQTPKKFMAEKPRAMIENSNEVSGFELYLAFGALAFGIFTKYQRLTTKY